MKRITRMLFVAIVVLSMASICRAESATQSKEIPSPKTKSAMPAIDKAALVPAGKFYKATVPDTLDLAERAAASINAMAGVIEPDKFYFSRADVFWGKTMRYNGLTWNLPCEYIFSFPLARTMSGSKQFIDIELGTMNSYMSHLADDGVIYSPMEDLGKPKGSCFPDNIGFVAFALANWYERDGNQAWIDILTKMCRGFEKMAIKVEDRAFYPPEYCYLPGGKWVPEGRGKLKPFEGKEPSADDEGFEGSVKYYHAAPLQAFVKCFKYTGDKQAIEMAGRIKNFMLKQAYWRKMEGEGYNGVERGIFGAHFHGNLIPMWALFNLALATGDESLKDMVRSGYEHALRYVANGNGWSPCYVYPGNWHGHPHPFCDGCNTADTILMAVKLTDAGLGDYWDEVEGFARNQLAENQFLDKDKMRRFLGGKNEAEIERYWGGFFQTEPSSLYPRQEPIEPGCCIASGPWGLYSAWHGITRFDAKAKTATVNMFFNRASAWMDIDSYLPYEGKVVLKNKLAATAIVRVPGWLAGADVKCSINGKPARPARVDNKLIFTALKPKDAIVLEFPVKQWTQKVTFAGVNHTLSFRGLTMVDIQPRNSEAGVIPIYQREALKKAGKAPMREVTRFIADKLIPVP